MATNIERGTDRISRLRRMIEEDERAVDLYSPHFVSRTPWHVAAKRGVVERREQDDAIAQSMFSDVQIRVEDALEQGDKVVIRWRLKGTWSKPVARLQPTGKPNEITGTNIYRFVGGRIVEEHGEADFASEQTL